MSTPMTNKHKATKDKTHTNLSKIKLAKLCRWVMTQGFLVTVKPQSDHRRASGPTTDLFL